MRIMVNLSVFYAMAALGVLALTRDESVLAVFGAVWGNTVLLVYYLLTPLLFVLAAGVILTALFARNIKGGAVIIGQVGLAVFCTMLFHMSFSIVKTSIPDVVPFWADPLFANIDAWLHGGTDPWVAVYAIAAHLPMEAILPAYVYFWSLPSIGFFLILIALDRDPARIKRYVILYAIAWIACGNLLAMAGSSVGPVYYDRLLETDRFTDLLAALQSGAVNGSFIERLQGNLWDLHESGNQALGSGISAFPSVHVSSTMVLALYAHERLGRVGTVAGSAFVAVILFLSVYTGYHYAVDGYASIALMLLAYAYLKQPSKRRAPKPEVQAA